MITTTADRIRTILQGAGGKPFTLFMDALLRTHGHAYGVPDSNIDTTVRVNVPDGGVDTEVRVAIPVDTTTQWFAEPTVWQYKGTATKSLRLSELVKGAHLKRRILEGWAYRLAVADSMTAAERQKVEAGLEARFRAWNPKAPSPRVVTADELETWANRYTGLVLQTFYRDVARDLMHFEAWGASVRGPTPEFVPVPEWEPTRLALAAHIDFATVPPTAVRTVQGEAGVGKSRLAYETVHIVPGAGGLVVYAMEDSVLALARHLANDKEARAVLIADECDVGTRLQLGKLLDGHKARVRVIAIDNTLLRPDAPDPELVLVKMPRAALEEVLEKNFPEIDEGRRRAYVTVAEGFPRLAADLCLRDAAIAKQGDLSPAIPHIGEFYRDRLSAQQQRAVAALGLVSKIGYSGEVRVELEALCAFLGLPLRETLEALDSVHDGPGFVTRSGRYLQVTPELVAQVAFDDGWRRWARHEPTQFLQSFPPALLETFLNRAWRSAAEEVRRQCADHFHEWAERRTVADLSELAAVRRLVALIDTHPKRYLPMLRRLVEYAHLAELSNVTGTANERGEWGPRRALVWLAERFAQLPEHYDDAERILVRLAAAESEPNIANNATAIWGQGFRIFLSGTATQFSERLERLRARLRDPEPAIRAVARRLLKVPLSMDGMRMVGPAVVAGRIPPMEWRPQTNAELDQYRRAALELLADAVEWDAETREAALDALVHELRPLLAQGYLPEVRAIFDGQKLSDGERIALIDALDAALEYDAPDEGAADTAAQTYTVKMQAWRSDLVGTDLYSRLLALVGKERWGAVRVRDEEGWQRQVDELAAEFAAGVARGEDGEKELAWLCSPAAQAASEFGEALGRQDVQADLFGRVFGTAPPKGDIALIRGYAHGLIRTHPEHAPRLNAWIDATEAGDPEIAADVALSVGAPASPLERVLLLYDAGKLGARYLYGRNFPPDDSGELPTEVLRALLQRLAVAAEDGDAVALRVGLDNLAMRLPYRADASPHPLLLEDPELRMFGWRLLEASPPSELPPSHWWDSLVIHLGRVEARRAARFLATFLSSSSLPGHHGLERALTELAATHPAEIMEAVGKVMLDDTVGLRFFLGDYKSLFNALPDDVKLAWLEGNGVEGARRIARHLAPPSLSDSGEPVVPPLTAWVLERFEADDRTFHEFVAGVHSWQWYRGDIAAQHEAEAVLARRFLDHALRRVREWAAIEERRALAQAAAERVRVAEQDLE